MVDEDGAQLGVMATAEARRIAAERFFDLIVVAPNAKPPVCRIGDYGKFRYEQAKKEKEARKSSKAGSLKEMKLTPKIGKHDLDVRVRRAKEFLTKRHKVKFTLSFRGREMAHQDLGRQLLETVKEELVGIGEPEGTIKREGKRLIQLFSPK